MKGMRNLSVVAIFDVKKAHELLMSEFGFNNVSARMLLSGTPFLIEEEKQALVSDFNENNGGIVLVKLEDVEDEG